MDNTADISNTTNLRINIENCGEINELLHEGTYPLLPGMRPTAEEYNRILLKNRKQALKQLFNEDVQREDAELRIIGRAYMRTHP
ncbi:hypothetical protein CBL_12360 [Carabus blaptoides fortunei]